MKTLKYIALAALTISFAACTQDEDFIPQGDGDAVKITATIGALQTRVSYDANGNTTFGEGDQIRVINLTRSGMNKSDAVYRRGSTDNWEPAEATKYVVWHGTETNTFYGVYPYDAEYDNFTISTDQSSDITAADWMTATYTGVKGTSNNVSFNFRHLLAKVTVNITEWNDEFDGEAQTVSNPKIYTKGTAIEVSYGTGTDGADEYISNGGLTAIWPYATGQTYTAIVAPVKYAANNNFMTFTVNGQEMTVLAKTGTLTGGLESGKHYTFNLSVGKDAVTLSSVTVSDWANGGTIDGGVAKECEHETTSNNGTCAECGKQVYVDLGLSVNWATVNIGATKPEEAGDFFAWGETAPKETYNWSTYKWCNGSRTTMTKYCTSSSYGYNGFTDNITELDLADDAAVQNWGDRWMMPTQDQLAELANENNCTWTWTTVNGVQGYQITSKVPGYEGNTIFLPYALYKDDENSSIIHCIYWTSTLYTKYDASYAAIDLKFNSNNNLESGDSRYRGALIRPVREK